MRILIVDDLPRNWKIEQVSYNLNYLENKTGEKVFNGYLISMSVSEIVSASLFSSGYTLAIFLG